MRRPSAIELRVFLTCWIVLSVHFATNVVREHYPAFSLIERGDFVLDRYAGMHSDIFEHDDGHWYIGNQVGTSLLAAIPLLAFDPLLDRLEEARRGEVEALAARGEQPDVEYRTPYPIRQEFLRRVRAEGLDLRFGAATFVTGAFLMAPLSALVCVVLLRLLLRQGVERRRAVWLTLLFAFGTPLFYRTAPLNNNLVLMAATFLAFVAVWPPPRPAGAAAQPLSLARRFGGGLLAGSCLALDYSGAVVIPVLYAYVVLARVPAAGWWRALRESAAFALGCVPGLLLLWATQWAMYGDPFLPGQYHMPTVNYTEHGWRGISLPMPDLFLENLFSPNFGLLPYGPLLVLGFVPLALARRVRGAPRGGATAPSASVLPAPERRFVFGYVLAFLLFCAMNQYSRMQWNTGFRYLIVLVPFLYLAACDVLARMGTRTLALVSVPAVLHTWVLSMTRYTVPSSGGTAEGNAVLESWRLVLADGLQLPWLEVLRATRPPDDALVQWAGWPYVVLGAAGLALVVVWTVGRRAERPLGEGALAR